MFIYTVQRTDYDGYPMGNVIATVGPFDTRVEAMRHGEKRYENRYISVKELMPPA